ncbi:hypothetical protein NDU88_001112 [Pleurodeles waltl]|uniref:Uncharacterized protein n=1 Tax=Pleurodeles waltl TaxID=8319 RepID=A0AAV7Q255_PLEWA|nr:hypothetical protein NDU88_001112 [Pleurodeles waltl]
MEGGLTTGGKRSHGGPADPRDLLPDYQSATSCTDWQPDLRPAGALSRFTRPARQPEDQGCKRPIKHRPDHRTSRQRRAAEARPAATSPDR